ncbi:MAG TPA: NUDIX hydrolase [Gammaproteobacteria bacterium]|nr:NUDIX hydrolase [Gammaproteobacteria bacterium]
MHREALRQLLTNYHPVDPIEVAAKQKMLDFLNAHEDCFERTCVPGHFTGSCWLVSADFDKALLTHHTKLDTWLQLGGHCDGDPDLLQVALKEAKEESGLVNIVPVSTAIFDIDVHGIPAHKNDPEHLHYDVRFLLRVLDDADVVISPESKDLRWFGSDIAQLPTLQPSIVRMFKKWQALR